MPRLKQKRMVDNTDLLFQLNTMSFDEIEKRLGAGEDDLGLVRLMGYDEAKSIQAAAAQPRARAFGDAVVLLPGLMGSLLLSTRGVVEFLWINPLLFLNGNARYLTGDPPLPEIEAVPFSLEKLSYTKIAITLRKRFPVFEFPYDWRLSLEGAVEQLHACLQRWATANPGVRFTLVGHSMGGVLSRAYLARHTAWAEQHVKRVVTLGSPYLGATSAVENLYLGNSICETMDKLNDKNGMAQVLMTMPGVYQLLPVPPELFPSGKPYPFNWDLYDAAAWQKEGIRQPLLDAARHFHTVTAQADPQIPLVQIAGCNLSTSNSVTRTPAAGGGLQTQIGRADEGPDSGDGTVPSWSSASCGAKVYYIQEVHRSLPNNAQVIQAVMDLVESGVCSLPDKFPPKKEGFALFRDLDVPPDTRAVVLREKTDAGALAKRDLEQFYFAG